MLSPKFFMTYVLYVEIMYIEETIPYVRKQMYRKLYV